MYNQNSRGARGPPFCFFVLFLPFDFPKVWYPTYSLPTIISFKLLDTFFFIYMLVINMQNNVCSNNDKCLYRYVLQICTSEIPFQPTQNLLLSFRAIIVCLFALLLVGCAVWKHVCESIWDIDIKFFGMGSNGLVSRFLLAFQYIYIIILLALFYIA